MQTKEAQQQLHQQQLHQLHQHCGQWGIQGHPAGFDGSMSEQAYAQLESQLHPLHPLGVEERSPRLFKPVSLDPDLLHQSIYVRENDYGTAQAEHNERRRRAKGKKEEAEENRRKGKGKDKKESPDQSQTSSSTSSSSRESHDAPAWADHSLTAPVESTFGPHQATIDIDTMIRKRLKYLRKSDTAQRNRLGLPNRSKHDTLFRMFAKDRDFSHDWKPVQPRTQVEFERDLKIAKQLVEDARELLDRPNEPPEVLELCQEVTTAFDKAKEKQNPKSDRWGDRAASTRKARGLPKVDEQKRMEQIIYGHPVKEQLDPREESDARLKVAGETFDFALHALKRHDVRLKLEDAREELLSICSVITKRRDKCLEGKREAAQKKRKTDKAKRLFRRAARSHARARDGFAN